VEAYSRIYRHRDGTRTESFKNGNKTEIREFTYNKENILQIERLFVTDSKGRCRRGVIFDGRRNPLGSIDFGFDDKTDQLVEERQFNAKGQLVRRLFYPGTVKNIKGLENRFVALNYDPDNPNAAPVRSKEEIKPTRPVETEQDKFEPGIPIGKSAPAANASSSSSNNTAAAPAPAAGTRKRFFGGGAPPTASAAPAPAPPPPPPPAVAPVPSVPATPPVPIPAPKHTAPVRKPRT
jgi:hypothetical protein